MEETCVEKKKIEIKKITDPIQLQSAPFFNRRSIDYATIRFESRFRRTIEENSRRRAREPGQRVPRNGDTVAKEPARDESLPRSGLLTRLQQLEHDLRHRVVE